LTIVFAKLNFIVPILRSYFSESHSLRSRYDYRWSSIIVCKRPEESIRTYGRSS